MSTEGEAREEGLLHWPYCSLGQDCRYSLLVSVPVGDWDFEQSFEHSRRPSLQHPSGFGLRLLGLTDGPLRLRPRRIETLAEGTPATYAASCPLLGGRIFGSFGFKPLLSRIDIAAGSAFVILCSAAGKLASQQNPWLYSQGRHAF